MKKYFITLMLALVCIFALVISVGAKEYMVSSDSEYQAAYESAVDGDTIVVSQKLTAEIQATKDIIYILKADWESAKINVASDAEVSFVADGGNYKIMPSGYSNSGWLAITEAKENVTLNFMGINGGAMILDGSKATNEYVSNVTVASDITWNFFDGSAIANFNPTTKATGNIACIIYANTFNMYEGSQIYANQIVNVPLIKTNDFHMHGGEIFGNLLTSVNNSEWNCGAIYVKNQFVMLDGKIYNNIFKAKGSSQINYIGFITTVSEKHTILLGGEVGVNYCAGNTTNEISAMFGGSKNNKAYGYYTSDFKPGTRKIFTAGACELANDASTGKTIWQVINPTFGASSENWFGYSWVHYKGLCDNVASFFDVDIKQINGNSFYELDLIDLFVVGVTTANGSNVVAQRNYTYSYTGKTALMVPSEVSVWSTQLEDFCHQGKEVSVDEINASMPVILYASYENPITEINGTTACIACGKVFACENPEHDKDVIFIYGSYTENGNKVIRCYECNTVCTVEAPEEAPALFTFLGYSASEVDDGDITMGYSINTKAIKLYEQNTSNTLSYGMYVALYDVLDKEDILNNDEAPSNGVIKIDLSNAEYSKASVKIIGIQTEEQKATKLLVGAYVISANSETKEISYLENGLKGENDKYCYITYNYVAGIA